MAHHWLMTTPTVGQWICTDSLWTSGRGAVKLESILDGHIAGSSLLQPTDKVHDGDHPYHDNFHIAHAHCNQRDTRVAPRLHPRGWGLGTSTCSVTFYDLTTLPRLSSINLWINLVSRSHTRVRFWLRETRINHRPAKRKNYALFIVLAIFSNSKRVETSFFVPTTNRLLYPLRMRAPASPTPF